MEMIELKTAIDSYTDTAEKGLSGLKQRLDAVETKLDRPGSAPEAKADTGSTEHKNAFLKDFIARGDDHALRGLEAKALSTSTGGDGGFAVPTEIDTEIEKQLVNLSPLRNLVKVKTTTTGDYKRLVNVGGTASGWVGEAGARSETTSPSLQEVALIPGEIYANAAATQRALDDMQFDAESWLMDEVAEEFAVQEAAAIVNGDGVNKPKGILAYTTASTGDDVRAFGTLQHVATGTDGAFPGTDPSDVLVDLVHTLKARYRMGASWVMNSQTLSQIRKFKDADGNFIWRPSLENGAPSLLLGYPVVESEDMPDVGSNSLSIAFGNFERAYTLVERAGTRVLRDPYTNKPYVHFYATRRVGGGVVNSDAVKLLQFSL